MKGLFSWVGFRQTSVIYDRNARHTGMTTWSWWRLWNFAIDGIASFSTLPLRVSTLLGLAISLVAFCYAMGIILETMIFGTAVPGFPSLMISVMFFSLGL